MRHLQHTSALKGQALADLASVCTLMIDLQDKQNKIVNPEWHKAKYPFMRAAWREVAEAHGHTTWEFWKNLDDNYHDVFRREEDIPEFHMELVDALHFLISAHLQGYLGDGSAETGPWAKVNAAQGLMSILDRAYARSTSGWWPEEFGDVPGINATGTDATEWTHKRIESLLAACLSKDISRAFELLVETAEHTELGLVGLIGRYFAKATLNQHRWAHGYKEGTYVKKWGDGKEDNYYLNRTVISQLEGMELDTLLTWIADGSWTKELAEDLNEMYENVLQRGHAYCLSVAAPLQEA